MAVDVVGGGTRPVYLAFDHRLPALGQVVDALVAYIAVFQRQRARHDQRVFVVRVPQPVDDDGHVLEHAAGALEFFQSGPILVEPVEDLRVDRVGAAQTLEVFVGLGLNRELVGVLPVEVGKLAADAFHLSALARVLEQPPAHDLERFLGAHRLPDRLHPGEVFLQGVQGTLAHGPTHLQFGLG